MTYTAADFAQAKFATKGNDFAARLAVDSTHPWAINLNRAWTWRPDEWMANEGWTPVVESRITLDSLREAWENAEVPTDDAPIREGDVVIQRVSRDHFHVFHETHNWVAAPDCADVRILSRAPREPWQDLADVLRAWDEEPMDADLMGRAKWFYEQGVRVTGGEES